MLFLLLVSLCLGLASYAVGLRHLGICFIKTQHQAVDVADEFMTTVLNIQDESFREECSNHVAELVKEAVKETNGKIVSSYRKLLGLCKLCKLQNIVSSLCAFLILISPPLNKTSMNRWRD